MTSDLLGGRYRLLERRGVGGTASLWRARDERTGETVALKRLHPFLVTDPRARDRLLHEATALQALDHPSIVRPRDVIHDADDPALVMEFAAGRSLQERLASDGPIAPEEATGIAITIADALAVAHAAGIVHRDIKPANILVEGSGALHLVDFGIATSTDAAMAGLTATDTIVGTLRYAAPERLAGADATPPSDVWSLGAVLYEMLTGFPAVPDDRGAPNAVALPAVDLLPPPLAAIVRQAMSPDPSARYPDAAAFRDALLVSGTIDEDAPTVVIPVGEPEAASPMPRGVRRMSSVDRAAAVFFGGVVVVALVAAVILGVGGFDRTSGALAPAARPSLDAAAPVATSAAVPPGPPENPAQAKGKGKGHGHGKGNGD